MKKLFSKMAIFAMIATLTLAMCSCGAGNQDDSEAAGLANPVHETDAAGLTEATGISLDAPEGADDVVYSYIDPATEDGNPIAQVTFTFEGKPYTYRCVSTAETSLVEATDPNEDLEQFQAAINEGISKGAELAGLAYDDWNAATIIQVGDRDGVYGQSHESVSFVAWLDVVPGFMYTMTAEEEVEQDVLLKVANSAFVPMQGEVG